jgi:hypothetical protein
MPPDVICIHTAVVPGLDPIGSYSGGRDSKLQPKLAGPLRQRASVGKPVRRCQDKGGEDISQT